MALSKSLTYDVLNGIGIFLILCIMISGLSVYLLPHFGWRIGGVYSGSMMPTIHRGDMVIGRPVEPSTVKEGDIIIFRPAAGDTLVVHRVVYVEKSPLYFITKGDASPTADRDSVPARYVVASVVFHMPVLGYMIMFQDTPVGFILSVILPGIAMTVICIYGIFLELKKK